jgi:pyruvate/2-oxoglutarate dehydrogenase complex dihydrolipoamide dehydrogenase (E3) component
MLLLSSLLLWIFLKNNALAYPYDLVIVGGGAAGFFAAGAASSFGKTIAIVDLRPNLGGDCTNAACVPSKALRSIVRTSKPTPEHMRSAVEAVRAREQPQQMLERNPNLDLHFVQSCCFTDSHTMELSFQNATKCLIKSRHFLLSVGADPVIPFQFPEQAHAARLPLWTYRSILRPEETEFWDHIKSGHLKTLLIVGGGPTACELGQSLGRLLAHNTTIRLVAPALLPEEDPSLQEAATKLLERAGVSCKLNVKMDKILDDKSIQLSDGSILAPVDGILLCVGRNPQLDSLHLHQAGVQWNENGVSIRPSTLQSTSASHIFAAGDCADVIDKRSRTSAHAAWMAFHAVRNMYVPWWLRIGSSSQHKLVPRVIYTDPEMARVGLTRQECQERCPDFQFVHVKEEGSDRADMERRERDTEVTFLEVRASPSGRILGGTACGAAAAELANSIGVAITNRLSVRDLAKSIHSYPSHGYLLYRVALSMALSDTRGFLESCGPVGKILAGLVGAVGASVRIFQSFAGRVVRGRKRRNSV